MTVQPRDGASPDWLEDWREWLEGDLFQQVHEILQQRLVFKSWNEIVDVAATDSKTPGLFHAWVNHNYIAALAVGVRRMCDRDTRTRSLVRLLEEIKEHAPELTREWWMGRWWPPDDEPSEPYLAQFDELSSGGDHVDPAVVQADLDRLTEVSGVIREYVNKFVAHLDGDRARVGPVTLGELHEAADTVYEVFHRWYELVTNVTLTVPAIEHWETVLTRPWITEEQAFAIFERRRAELKQLEQDLRRRNSHQA